MTDVSTLHRLRGFLLAIFSLGCLGTGTELFLVEHTEDAWQWAPLVLAAAGLLLAGWNTVRAGRVSGRAFQALMLLFLASAGVGLWLHHEANLEFEREIYPDLSGWALFLKAIRGTAPPSLAPMAMAVLGLLGLCWSYRHPVLDPEPSTTTQPLEPLR